MSKQENLSLVRRALEEDLRGYGDVTSFWTVPESLQGEANIIAREELVLCGLHLAELVLREVDETARFVALARDGELMKPSQPVARLQGAARSILTAERTMLNFLSHLCGIATISRQFAEVVKELPVKVVDTRKTTPGLRTWEKYAVLCGGCENHRYGLFDMVLIKNNHIAAVGGVTEAVHRVKEKCPHTMKIEIEVENADDLRAALAAGADIVMLDNRSPEELKELVQLARSIKPDVVLEASGGVTKENVRAIAESGVNIVSTSAITMGAPAANLSLRIRDSITV